MAVTLKITAFRDVTQCKSGRRLMAPWFWRTRCVHRPKKSQRTKQPGILDSKTSEPVNSPQHRSFLTENYWALCQICGHYNERLLQHDACTTAVTCPATRPVIPRDRYYHYNSPSPIRQLPCSTIPMHSYNKNQREALFLKFIFVKNSTCFGQIYCPSAGVSTRGGVWGWQVGRPPQAPRFRPKGILLSLSSYILR